MDATAPTDSRPDAAAPPDSVPHPSFAEAFQFWLKLGFISFGGPAGQIGIMHQELVERRRWFTFFPCFLFIFLGAPYIERLRSEKRLEAALSGITAAVVGVMLNLAVWFGRQALIPVPGQVDPFAVCVGLAAFAAVRWGKVGVPLVVLLAGIAGLVASFLGW
jgi:chromate transport protein ChrA